MTTNEYIDKLRALTATRSDYAVAKLLDLTPEAVHGYTRKGRTMNNTQALRVAQLLQIPAIHVIADMELERAKDETTRALWTRFRKGFGRRAAAVLLFLLAAALIAPNESDAQHLISDSDSEATSVPACYPSNNYTNLALLLWSFVLGLFGWRDGLQLDAECT